MFEPLQCLSGVLTGEPQLTISQVGRCRFSASFQTPHHTHGRHAAFTITRANLIVVGPIAERAYAQFTEGDRFLAEGAWIVLASSDREGAAVEFFARHLGHDLAQRRYAVDRTRRRGGWQPYAPAHLLTNDWAAPLLNACAAEAPGTL